MDELDQKMVEICANTPGAITFCRDKERPQYVRIKAVLSGETIIKLKCEKQLKEGKLQDKFVAAITEYFMMPHVKEWAANYRVIIPNELRFYGNTQVGNDVISGTIEDLRYVNLNYQKCSIIVQSTLIRYNSK